MNNRHSVHISVRNEAELQLVAELVAAIARPGDVIALSGELGVGKSTFARAFIRAVLDDAGAEVPSPTFAIAQHYDSRRFAIQHFDLYRLGVPDELAEIGLPGESAGAVCLVEWPERAGDLLPADRIDVGLSENGAASDDGRHVVIAGSGPAASRFGRLGVIWRLVARAGAALATAPADLRVRYLQGDASARSYARLVGNRGSAILMVSPPQPDGPPIRDGMPYSRIAHLAETIVPTLAISATLRRAGFSAPGCLAADPETGLAVIEDLGDRVFGSAAAADVPQEVAWAAAVDVLIALRGAGLPREATSDDGLRHALPTYDTSALEIEIGLLAEWYLPYTTGRPPDPGTTASLLDAWRPFLARLAELERGWVLRDFHSPNLIWLPDRDGTARVGLIDTQDALLGHPAYDLASLLQDARVDVPAALEARERDRYIAAMCARDANFDEAAFRWAYALLGAQRSTKILGIFARLAQRDGKPAYLRHLPRVRSALDRNLAHPALADLARWYKAHLPPPPEVVTREARR